MTYNNPNPLANPLNSGRFSNMTAYQGRSYIKRCADPRKLEVPNQDPPMFGTEEWLKRQNMLTTPNQDVPLGDQLKGCGFIAGSDNLFRLSDGTILDFESGRILKKPRSSSGEYWGDPNKTITYGMEDRGWNEPRNGWSNPSLEDLVNHTERYEGTLRPDGTIMEPLDPNSVAYWLKAEEEAKKMEDQMTDAQKKLFADFESHFPKSKLIEESLKR